MKIIPIICVLILSAVAVRAQDVMKVDPKHYKVLLNNREVRVMAVHIGPGEKVPMHSHPNHVIYSMTGGTTKFTLKDGKSDTTTVKAGTAVWHNAETHTVENTGKKAAESIDIELKK